MRNGRFSNVSSIVALLRSGAETQPSGEDGVLVSRHSGCGSRRRLDVDELGLAAARRVGTAVDNPLGVQCHALLAVVAGPRSHQQLPFDAHVADLMHLGAVLEVVGVRDATANRLQRDVVERP